VSAALFDVIYTEVLAIGHKNGEPRLFPQALVQGQPAIMTATTIGIMVKHTRANIYIENLLIGGPAMLGGHLTRGDVILAVDGRDVSKHAESFATRLIGSDIPGSLLGLQVRKKNGQVIDVMLARIAAEDIDAKRLLFELLARLQDSITSVQEKPQQQNEGDSCLHGLVAQCNMPQASTVTRQQSLLLEECAQVWVGIVDRDAQFRSQVLMKKVEYSVSECVCECEYVCVCVVCVCVCVVCVCVCVVCVLCVCVCVCRW
jgi:hypothetical protein